MLANNIVKLLDKQGKKQGELAIFAGVKPNTVSDWINKGNSPKVEHLCRIAEFFDVSLDFLITGKEKYATNAASHISNSAIVQGNHATTLIVKNGKTEEWGLSEQAFALLKIFDTLDVKKQTLLLCKAYELEEQQGIK